MTLELAKPSGITLDEHNRNLRAEAVRAFEHRAASVSKYKAETECDLVELLGKAVDWHDQGKTDPRWQIPCQQDFHDFLQSGRAKPLALRLMKAGIRHEMASLSMMVASNCSEPAEVIVAVAAHHGKLSYKYGYRWSDFAEYEHFWKEFEYLSRNAAGDRPHLSTCDEFFRLRYRYAGPRSLLQLVDRRASALEADVVLEDFKPFVYEFAYRDAGGMPSLRGVQHAVESFRDEPFAILRAPTGSGKTDAALLWAQHQISLGKADRVVVAMPTRFTAGALALNVAGSLSSTGLYHSSSFLLRTSGEQEMARLLESPATVTTIDHLCIALTGAREDHHAIFFNLMNSCVVIDEADFYDDFTQQNIVILLSALRLLRVPVLLMSATVPDSSISLYEKAGYSGLRIHSDNSQEGLYEAARPRCNLQKVGTVTSPEDIRHILSKALQGAPLIIYANTVKRAQEYYRWFEKQKCVYPVVLYHSRFTEPDKAKKEHELLELLGQKSWKEGTERGIAILTQIGELSVNISSDVMISDLCPADRLAQRAGRLCRFNLKIGDLYLVDPAKLVDNQAQTTPAPYGRLRKKVGWEPSEAYESTRHLLTEGIYSANDFVDIVNKVYPELKMPSSRALTNADKLKLNIKANWLICPAAESGADDDETDSWYSRDIPPQATVYAEYAINLFDTNESKTMFTWREFRIFELNHGIQCQKYELNKAIENAEVESITFKIVSNSGDEITPRRAFIVSPSNYDYHCGLSFGLQDE